MEDRINGVNHVKKKDRRETKFYASNMFVHHFPADQCIAGPHSQERQICFYLVLYFSYCIKHA